MIKDNVKRLNSIISTTKESMSDSIEEVKEISKYASIEYSEAEAEYLRLKFDTEEYIRRVDVIRKEYQKSREKLREVNLNYSKYTEEELREQYEDTDSLRDLLEKEEQKEKEIRIRRNTLEMHVKNVRHILEKSEKARSNFEMALSIISGELQRLTDNIGDIENKEIWGMKVIEAEEKERQRIARDLHDGPAQNLTNLLIKTEVCLKLIETDIDKTKNEMLILKHYLKDTINETRRMIYNLRPMSIDDLGLIPTLERYVDKSKDESGVNIVLDIQGIEYYKKTLYKETIILTVFRILQESLTNAIKYANCDIITVDLTFMSKKIILTVIDDGDGFNVNDIELSEDSSSGFGISMMKERANLLNSKFTISSKINEGTKIQLVIFLDEKEEDKNENN